MYPDVIGFAFHRTGNVKWLEKVSGEHKEFFNRKDRNVRKVIIFMQGEIPRRGIHASFR